MTDKNPRLAELNLTSNLIRALRSNGFERLGDLRHLSTVDLLRLPGLGGYGFDRLLKALGRPPLGTGQDR